MGRKSSKGRPGNTEHRTFKALQAELRSAAGHTPSRSAAHHDRHAPRSEEPQPWVDATLGRIVSTRSFEPAAEAFASHASRIGLSVRHWVGRPALYYATRSEIAGLVVGGNALDILRERLDLVRQDAELGPQSASTLAMHAPDRRYGFNTHRDNRRRNPLVIVRSIIPLSPEVQDEVGRARDCMGLYGPYRSDAVQVNLFSVSSRDMTGVRSALDAAVELMPTTVELQALDAFQLDNRRAR